MQYKSEKSEKKGVELISGMETQTYKKKKKKKEKIDYKDYQQLLYVLEKYDYFEDYFLGY